MMRRRLGVILVIALVVAIPGVVATARLVTAASDLRAAESRLDEASDALRDGRIADAQSDLASAEAILRDVNHSLRASVSVGLVGLFPVAGQNLAALRESVELATVVVHGGLRILESSEELEGPDGTLQVSLSDGSIPLDDLEAARLEVDKLLEQLPAGRLDESSPLLLPPTRELWKAVHEETARRRVELDRLDRGLTLLYELVGADRPRRFLIAVANTAEMRGAGGMMLNYGVLEGSGGQLELGNFGRVEELQVPTAVDPSSVGIPDDLLARWSGFDITREWRNTTVAAGLPIAAPALKAMFRRATGLPVDGIIHVDPAALAGILGATGPVEVAELGTVDANNVEALVLNEAYRLFPGVEERTDVLGDVAEATFRRLVDGEFPSVRDLAVAVADAVDGRHLMVESGTPETEAAIQSFTASGDLPAPDQLDAFHLTVQNVSGNKLDYYLDTHVDITGARPIGEIGEIDATIRVTNAAPVGETQPRYIFGPLNDEQQVGLYRGVVSLYVPLGTELVSFSGGPYRIDPAIVTENGRPVVSVWVDIPAGQTLEIPMELTLAPSSADYTVTFVPSPRVRDTTVVVDVVGPEGPVQGEAALDRTWTFSRGGPTALTGYGP